MRRMAGEALRFAIVGVANTLVGLFAIYGMLFFTDAGPVVANACGYAIGFIVSFVLNRAWSFRSNRSVTQDLPRYLAVAATSYCCNLAVVVLGAHLFPRSPYAIQFLGIATYTTLMFLGCRMFVFRKSREPSVRDTLEPIDMEGDNRG